MAGGVCLMLKPDWRMVEFQLGVLSPFGHLRPMAAQADGKQTTLTLAQPLYCPVSMSDPSPM